MRTCQNFRDTVSLAARGQIDPIIDRVLPLANLAEGHRATENRDVFGKIVIRPCK